MGGVEVAIRGDEEATEGHAGVLGPIRAGFKTVRMKLGRFETVRDVA